MPYFQESVFNFSQELTGSVVPSKKVTFCQDVTRSRALLILKALLMIGYIEKYAMLWNFPVFLYITTYR